jgi:hypothetical protein
MSAWLGVPLALAALLAGGWLMGWQGVVLAMSGIVLWLVLQFTQLMKVMRATREVPLGHVQSAVMLNAKLHEGMKLLQVLQLTGSLGVKVAGAGSDPAYRWTDAGGDSVVLTLAKGRVTRWKLEREATS